MMFMDLMGEKLLAHGSFSVASSAVGEERLPGVVLAETAMLTTA